MNARLRALLGGCLLVAGCAGVQPAADKPADPKAAVQDRAQKRWDAMVAGDFKTAYQFLSPGLREANSYESWSGSLNAGFWKEAKVRRAECESQDLCTVVSDVTYEHQGRRINTPVRESWIRVDGQWWFVQK